MTRLELKPAGVYSFAATTRRLVSFEKSAYQVRDGRLYRTLRVGGRPIVVGLGWRGEALFAEVEEVLTPAEEEALTKTLRRMFSLDVNLEPFYVQMEQVPELAALVRERNGLHMVLDPDLYECLIKTIIGQQLNLAFAATLIRRLIDLAGEEVAYRGELLPVFPTPEQVARLDYADLQALQFNRRKAEYVIDLSRKIVDGSLDLTSLLSLPDEEVVERLLPLRGVGRWTAECLLLFGMGRPNLLPAADIGLRNAVRRVYHTDAQPTEQEVRQLGGAWAPWSSYAVFYLWDYLSQPETKE
ncbi:DNA-3-methyladenine glycosylase family protein [Salinithrix halophila]|uniref:DNA-3-methyladenine glycosylase family protein n=1 Tax=Salinithrix halophila TaxID=1485204 RepID=UPI0036D335EF